MHAPHTTVARRPHFAPGGRRRDFTPRDANSSGSLAPTSQSGMDEVGGRIIGNFCDAERLASRKAATSAKSNEWPGRCSGSHVNGRC